MHRAFDLNFWVHAPRSIYCGAYYTTFPAARGRRHGVRSETHALREALREALHGPSANVFPVAGHPDPPSASSIGCWTTPILSSPSFLPAADIFTSNTGLQRMSMLLEGHLVWDVDTRCGLPQCDRGTEDIKGPARELLRTRHGVPAPSSHGTTNTSPRLFSPILSMPGGYHDRV